MEVDFMIGLGDVKEMADWRSWRQNIVMAEAIGGDGGGGGLLLRILLFFSLVLFSLL